MWLGLVLDEGTSVKPRREHRQRVVGDLPEARSGWPTGTRASSET